MNGDWTENDELDELKEKYALLTEALEEHGFLIKELSTKLLEAKTIAEERARFKEALELISVMRKYVLEKPNKATDLCDLADKALRVSR